jgi:hypothetical protein
VGIGGTGGQWWTGCTVLVRAVVILPGGVRDLAEAA